jgi:hypothetical protein
VLSPILFSACLYFFIQFNPSLKKLAQRGKLLAFADDMLIIFKNTAEAEDTLKAFCEIQ